MLFKSAISEGESYWHSLIANISLALAMLLECFLDLESPIFQSWIFL